MTDILKKIKNWDFTNKDSSIQLGLDYSELAEVSDIVDRKIWFVDEVNEYVISSVAYNILRYNALDKGIPVKERKPIILYINSPGGSVFDGMGLVSAIQTSKTPVYTINLANCCSMGLIIFLVGHKRYTMPNSIFLMHEGYSGTYDASSKARETITFETGPLADAIKKTILDKTKLTPKEYDKRYKEEWYFLPDIAKKYGFTDYIIGEDCDLDEII